MGRSARINSIDSVQAMAVAVDRFHADAANALDELSMEIRRALEWIHHDRKEHWAGEVRRGWEQLSEARVQLQQATTARRVADHQPSCVDERKAVERATRRLEVAQTKVEAVRRWTYVIDRAVNECRASCSPLNNWLDAEAPRALATLRRIGETLEAYLAVEVPGATGSLPAGVEAPGGAGGSSASVEAPMDESPEAPSVETPEGVSEMAALADEPGTVRSMVVAPGDEPIGPPEGRP